MNNATKVFLVYDFFTHFEMSIFLPSFFSQEHFKKIPFSVIETIVNKISHLLALQRGVGQENRLKTSPVMPISFKCGKAETMTYVRSTVIYNV